MNPLDISILCHLCFANKGIDMLMNYKDMSMNPLDISIMCKLGFSNMGLDMLMNREDISTNPIRLFNRVLAVRFKYRTKSILPLQRHFNEIPGHFNRVPAVLFK